MVVSPVDVSHPLVLLWMLLKVCVMGTEDVLQNEGYKKPTGRHQAGEGPVAQRTMAYACHTAGHPNGSRAGAQITMTNDHTLTTNREV